jgi:hypothetical protein
MVGMICGLALDLYLWLCTSVSFTWYVVLGSAATFLLGYGASRMMPRTDLDRRVEGVKCV